MRRSSNLMQLTWILVIALMLLPLFTFISCADDIVGLRFEDDEDQNPDERNEEEDPNNDGGGGGGMVLSHRIVPYV